MTHILTSDVHDMCALGEELKSTTLSSSGISFLRSANKARQQHAAAAAAQPWQAQTSELPEQPSHSSGLPELLQLIN